MLSINLKSEILFRFKTKKGVKRKADTTTPGSVIRTPGYNPSFDTPANSQQLPKTTAAIENAVRKPRKELANESRPLIKPASSRPLEYCREILQELLGPEHLVRKFRFYFASPSAVLCGPLDVLTIEGNCKNHYVYI